MHLCNRPSPPLTDIVLFGLFHFTLPLKVFKTCLLGRDFHTLIKNASFSSPTNVGLNVLASTRSSLQSMWDLTIHPPSWPSILVDTPPGPLQGPAFSLALVPLSNLCAFSQSTPFRGPASSLTHRPVFGSDNICNSPSLPLVDIVLFGFSLSGFSSRFLKRVC